MDIAFHVFSGTGNTLMVCNYMKEKLEEYGNKVVAFSKIKKGELYSSSSDCIIIAYPVHAFNAPLPIINFIKNMKKQEEMVPVYLIQSSGEPLSLNDAAFQTPIKHLKKKGYEVYGCFSYVMPYNIIFPHSNGMASRMWCVARNRMDEDAKIITDLKKTKAKIKFHERIVSALLKIEHPAMPIIGRFFKISNDCIGCSLCVKNCPEQNISMKDGKPVFKNCCSGCMGCSFNCPKDAIRISILDGWRVNVKYDFNAAEATDDEICNYLKSSYLSYFHKYEEKD